MITANRKTYSSFVCIKKSLNSVKNHLSSATFMNYESKKVLKVWWVAWRNVINKKSFLNIKSHDSKIATLTSFHMISLPCQFLTTSISAQTSIFFQNFNSNRYSQFPQYIKQYGECFKWRIKKTNLNVTQYFDTLSITVDEFLPVYSYISTRKRERKRERVKENIWNRKKKKIS